MAPSRRAGLDQLYGLLHSSPCQVDDLIAAVTARAGGSELERLSVAAAVGEELNQLGDTLLGYFVDAARHAGHSWSQIGSALGVTKQAAQQRFVVPDLARFTDRARLVVEHAFQAAHRFGHCWVGGEHVLVGLTQVSDGVAAKVLAPLGISARTLKSKLDELVGGGVDPAGSAPDTASLTPRASRLLGELAPAEAVALGHNYVGTEHLLLALMRQEDGLACKTLVELGVDLEQVRENVLEAMSKGTAAIGGRKRRKRARGTKSS